MMEDKFFEELKKKVKSILGEKGSHGFSHIERVYKYSIAISKNLDVDLDVVKAAALLHDIARLKEEKGKTKDHAAQGSIDARKILSKTDFPKEKIDLVCKCIFLHNKKCITPVELNEIRVLQEADGLEAVGAMGVAREFSCNGEKNSWNNPSQNLLNLLIRNLNSNYFKLPIARQIAEEKVAITKNFINQFIKEYNLII